MKSLRRSSRMFGRAWDTPHLKAMRERKGSMESTGSYRRSIRGAEALAGRIKPTAKAKHQQAKPKMHDPTRPDAAQEGLKMIRSRSRSRSRSRARTRR